MSTEISKRDTHRTMRNTDPKCSFWELSHRGVVWFSQKNTPHNEKHRNNMNFFQIASPKYTSQLDHDIAAAIKQEGASQPTSVWAIESAKGKMAHWDLHAESALSNTRPHAQVVVQKQECFNFNPIVTSIEYIEQKRNADNRTPGLKMTVT